MGQDSMRSNPISAIDTNQGLAHPGLSETMHSSIYATGLAAFAKDLPELMEHYPRQFVVYHGDRRIGPAKEFKELDAICETERIPLSERVFRVVEPDETLHVS
jgi:hypothetical protein